MDLITNLPPADGFDSILVMVDHVKIYTARASAISESQLEYKVLY